MLSRLRRAGLRLACKRASLRQFSALLLVLPALLTTAPALGWSTGEPKVGPGGVVTPDLVLLEQSAVATPSSLQWLKDSRHLIFSLAAGPSQKSLIELLDSRTGKRRPLVERASPILSPNGEAIAYVSGEGTDRQLQVYYFDGRPSVKLGSVGAGYPGYNLGFGWSPDSTRIAYGFRPSPAAQPRDSTSSVVVMGGAGDLPPDSELWLVELATGVRRKLASVAGTISNVGWLWDKDTLFFASVVGGFEYRNDDFAAEVTALSLGSGQQRTLIKDAGVYGLSPVTAPDRRHLAFAYDPLDLPYPYFRNVAAVPVDGGPIVPLTDGVFVASAPVWSADSTTIYFGCRSAVFTQICATRDGKLRRLTAEASNATQIAAASSGELAWFASDAEGRVQIRTAQPDGRKQRILLDVKGAGGLILGQSEEIRWTSKDGLSLSGLLIKPVGYRDGVRTPLIVDIHGGPVGGVALEGSVLKSSALEWHMWAAKGYAVFVPDYRSSMIAGLKPVLATRERQDFEERNLDDVLSGVDHVIALGVADPHRLALIGHSAGSALVNWIIVRSRRFKAAVSYEGWAEQYYAYGSGMRVGGNNIVEWYFKGKPWDVPDNYRRNSAAEFVKGVTTPTLFISGDYGGASGISRYHHEFMYTALKQQGVPSELLVYRGEGHIVLKPENRRDLLTRVIDWIDTNIKGESPSKAPAGHK